MVCASVHANERTGASRGEIEPGASWQSRVLVGRLHVNRTRIDSNLHSAHRSSRPFSLFVESLGRLRFGEVRPSLDE